MTCPALTRGTPYLALGAAAVLACAAQAAPESDTGGATLATQAAAALESVVGETVASRKQTRYRNKATFFFASSDDGDGLALGSKAADDPGRVVPIGAEGCPLQAEEADDVLASLAAWAKQTPLRALDVHAAKRDEGALWQAVLRTAPGPKGCAEGGAEVHLDLLTAGSPSAAALAALEALAASLLEAHLPLARVLHTVATTPPPPDSVTARGGGRRQRHAPDATRGASVTEPVTTVLAARGGGVGTNLSAVVARPGGGAALRFEVAPRGFWQVNDEGTDELVRLVADGLALGLSLAQGAQEHAPRTATEDGGEAAAAEAAAEAATEMEAEAEAEAEGSARLVDLFCGAGLFGVSLAATGRFASVLGLELGLDSVESAGMNARANGVGALCRFEAADLAFSTKPPAALAAALAAQASSAQGSELVVVTDPPRAGLSSAMRAALRQSSARVLVYVSCDAQTLGRDLADMCGREGAAPAFRLARATPVDLTPHAARVETVCVLWRPSIA